MGLGGLLTYGLIQLTSPSPEKSARMCHENMAKIAASLEKFKKEKNGYPVNLRYLGEELPPCPSGPPYSYGYAGSSYVGGQPATEQRATAFTLSCAGLHKFELGSAPSP